MGDEALTFSELRKVQKQESRQDSLSELDDRFLIRVSDYLERKKEMDGENREYRNAKRVFEKIVSLREDKIVKNARLSVTSDLEASSLPLLPEEQELFRDFRQVFSQHRERIDESVDNGINQVEKEEEDRAPDENEETEEKYEEEEAEEGYEKLEITSHVPEFMGTDLETYGPFEEGDEVEVPEENAEILVNRGNAEKVEA